MADFLFARSYEDFDALAADGRAFDLDLVPTTQGVFRGSFVLAEVGPVQIVNARFERGLIQRGETPRGYRTFVVPAVGMRHLLWRGHNIGQDDLMVFPHSRELTSRSGPDFHTFVTAIHESHLETTADALGLADPETLIGKNELFRLAPGGLDGLRTVLSACFARLTQSDPRAESTVRDVVPRLLMLALVAARRRVFGVTPSRFLLVQQAEKLLGSSQLGSPHTVLSLAATLGTTERTLHRAFLEHYGDGPKAVIAARQLRMARQLLRVAQPERGRIAQIANGIGIWHMGKFAADYRHQFGELPSDTLNRGAV